jgi:hypothetical protein
VPSTGSRHFNSFEDFGDGFGARFDAAIAFAVDANADGVGVHVALSDHEHSVHFHLFGALDAPGRRRDPGR